jgi:predicted ATPase/DNA-binding SARP family transcriptional activator
VRFRILGPLGVEGDGAPVAVGGPKPRALLAALLVHRRTVVSVDRLVDALWGDQPPPGAVSALRAYLSRLRAVLGAPSRLGYRPPGYLLDVADDELDAAQFERLVAQARTLAAAGDHQQALDLLEAGLGLWRGEALAEFADLDFARAEAARLAELRLAATEERIDALLHLGRHDEAAAEAQSLVGRFPTRERPVTQLMRALYGAGRQADALAAYHELRRRLDDELAVEPAEPAQAMYSRILGHDPALVTATTRGNLPRWATALVGRAEEIAHVVAALTRAPLVTLSGVGGVGKTRLAVAVADRERARFPDGAWFCELAPLSAGGPVGHAVAVSLGVRQRQGLTIEQTVIEYLAHRRLLLVLDNCEHVLDAAARLVDQVVRLCPAVAVLATSREPLGVDGEQCWSVPPLPAENARTLFVQRARADRPDFAPDREEEGAIAEICRRLDGLPLAIELAAARMRAMSAAEIAGKLDGGGLLTGGARTALPRHQSLAAAIDWSYRLLSEPEQRAFARLSVFAGGADLAGVHGVCADPGTTEDDTLDLLTRLVDKSMVTAARRAGRSRYHVLETLRAYGRQRLREAGTDDAIGSRHARYFTDLAEHAARGLHSADERSWVERTLPDYDNLRVAFERAASDRDADLALRLVTSLPELVHLRVSYEAAGWAERVLDFAPPGHPLFAATAGAAARGAWNRGDFSRARQLAERAGGRAPPRHRPDRLSRRRARRRCPVRGRRRIRVAALLGRGRPSSGGRRPDPSGVGALLRRGVPRCTAHARTRASRGAGEPSGGRGDRQPDGVVDGTLRPRSRAQEVGSGPGAGPVRRGQPAGSVRAQLLVAGHRVDGGRGHTCRARRSRRGRPGVRGGCRPLGPGRRRDPAVAQPALCRAIAGPARRRRGCHRPAPQPRRGRQAVPAGYGLHLRGAGIGALPRRGRGVHAVLPAPARLRQPGCNRAAIRRPHGRRAPSARTTTSMKATRK